MDFLSLVFLSLSPPFVLPFPYATSRTGVQRVPRLRRLVRPAGANRVVGEGLGNQVPPSSSTGDVTLTG